MWFKNIQVFEFAKSGAVTPELLQAALKKYLFMPCIATLPSSSGWVNPFEDDSISLVHAVNGCVLICLQFEDKILPATVVTQEVKEQVKSIEKTQLRKVMTKEKYTLKDTIYNTLLQQAFTKKTKIYAYFDMKNSWLIVNTVNPKRSELFLAILKQTLPNVVITTPKLKKLPAVMTGWLQNSSYPNSLGIEKFCVLQDPNTLGRMIRCQQQELAATNILALLKDGYEVTQLALSWLDQITFIMKNDFSLCALKYQDVVLELAREDFEQRQEKLAADFIIMSDLVSKLVAILIAELKELPSQG